MVLITFWLAGELIVAIKPEVGYIEKIIPHAEKVDKTCKTLIFQKKLKQVQYLSYA